MKAAHHSGFGLIPGGDSKSPVRTGEAKSTASSPRVLIEFELVKNLMDGSNLGLGEVLVYGSPNEQAETSH